MRIKTLRVVSLGKKNGFQEDRDRPWLRLLLIALFFTGMAAGFFPVLSAPANRCPPPEWETPLITCFLEGDPVGAGETGDLWDLHDGANPRVSLTTYTVKKGDTLSSIARRFDTSTESIAAINNLTSPDTISVGASLLVLENSSGTIVRVAKGDTLEGISRRYGISVNDIMALNGLKTSDHLAAGQLLFLPGGKPLSPLQVATASRSESFSWPVEGTVTSGYGWRIHPISGKRTFHEGIDIAAPMGTGIKAASQGKVTYVGWAGNYGRLVVISHGNGVETRYGHLSGYAVSSDQQIAAGEIIGYVGQSGNATGPHCHFEIRLYGLSKNPKDYLR